MGAPYECAMFAPLTLKLMYWIASHSAFCFSMATLNFWMRNNNFDNASFATFQVFCLSSCCVLWIKKSLSTSSYSCNNSSSIHFAYGNWLQIEAQYSSIWLVSIVGSSLIGTTITLFATLSSTNFLSKPKFPSSSSKLKPWIEHEEFFFH